MFASLGKIVLFAVSFLIHIPLLIIKCEAERRVKNLKQSGGLVEDAGPLKVIPASTTQISSRESDSFVKPRGSRVSPAVDLDLDIPPRLGFTIGQVDGEIKKFEKTTSHLTKEQKRLLASDTFNAQAYAHQMIPGITLGGEGITEGIVTGFSKKDHLIYPKFSEEEDEVRKEFKGQAVQTYRQFKAHRRFPNPVYRDDIEAVRKLLDIEGYTPFVGGGKFDVVFTLNGKERQPNIFSLKKAGGKWKQYPTCDANLKKGISVEEGSKAAPLSFEDPDGMDLDAVVSTVLEAREVYFAGKELYFHCTFGSERSATFFILVLASILHKTEGAELNKQLKEKLIQFTQAKRPGVSTFKHEREGIVKKMLDLSWEHLQKELA